VVKNPLIWNGTWLLSHGACTPSSGRADFYHGRMIDGSFSDCTKDRCAKIGKHVCTKSLT